MLDKAFFLVCMVISFYITIRALQHFTYSEDALNTFVEQFKTEYIEDITSVSPSSACPSGYSPLLSNFKWPGNYQGCGCKNTEQGNFTFYSNLCPFQNCTDVKETQPIDLPYWDSILLCFRRSERNYVKLINNIIPNNQTLLNQCNNATHRICGPIDNLNNQLCLEKTFQCPITNFFISRNQTEIEQYKLIDSTASITQINNSSYYIVVSHSDSLSSNNTKKLYNQFKVDITQPCLNKYKNPSSEVIFELMKNRFDLSCDKYKNGTEIVDELYDKIDTITYTKYIKENNIYNMIQALDTSFNLDIEKLNISIYAKTYPGWSFMCMKFDADTFKNFLVSGDILTKLSFYTIIHAFLIIMVLIGIGVCAFYFVENFDKLFYIIILGYIVLNLLYPIQVISNANWIVNNLSEETGIYCGDDSLNVLLYDISDACLSLLYSYVSILCVAILCLIVYIIILQAWVKPAINEVQERLMQLRQFN